MFLFIYSFIYIHIYVYDYIYIYIIFISDMHREEFKKSYVSCWSEKHRKGQGKWQGKGWSIK